MEKNKIYIPTFISSIDYKPARVLPHIYFYNGVKSSDAYYVENLNSSGSIQYHIVDFFPYFDNYEGLLPSTGSRSLLFFNEPAVYGETPTGSLYSEYWEDYVTLLYNPRTRIIDASAIIPLADYFKMELNDVVEWRGNYYHLRAINDYNLSNGECTIELLGPLLKETTYNVLPTDKCAFNFDITNPPTPTSSVWTLYSCTSSISYSAVSFDTTSSLQSGSVIKWDGDTGCYSLVTSSAATASISGAIVLSIYDNCMDCTGSVTPTASCELSCSSNLYLTYTGNDYYAYPTKSICSDVSSSFSISWTTYERPNRISVYDANGLVVSTGWKGDVNYSGPWGLSLHTATNGITTGTFTTGSGRYLLVEAGGGGGVYNDDACSITLNCS